MSQIVLVVASHPDDEVLMCGATIARHARNGDKVHIFIVAEGMTARDGGENVADGRELLQSAARKAASVLGAASVDFGSLPDQKLDAMPLLDVVKTVERILEKTKPQIVYTHHGGDLNKDHRIVHQAVLTAARPLPGSPVQAIYAGETLSSTEYSTAGTPPPFLPSHYVDVTAHLQQKLDALAAYEMEMRPFPHARSFEAVEALATTRGAQIGRHRAEAFITLRNIWA
ncbi:MAG: PIG-L family deacetylase [Alphaproteobacteria bacterium]|nr:PIG-L family deacetylase [Alphaproteobacteria bacterium]